MRVGGWMCYGVCVKLVLVLGASPVRGEEWQVPASVIREGKDAPAREQARTFLSSDVVDMEFRVQDASDDNITFNTKGYQRPEFNHRVQTEARSQISETLVWENGLDLAVYRRSHWDAGAKESVHESWKPEYRNRFILRPWEKSEFSLTQTTSVEQRADQQRSSDLFRNNLVFKQQVGPSGDFRLEATQEERTEGGLRLPVESDLARVSFSQQLVKNLKFRLGLARTNEIHHGNEGASREVVRQEGGWDWKATRELSFYGGAALEQEKRPQWLDEEALTLYEFRSRWVPDPQFQMSSGFSIDSRQENTASASGRSRWFLQGDLQATQEFSLSTQMRWEQWERHDRAGEVTAREEKFYFGTGPKIKIDESTRFSAEYGLARESTGTAPRDSGVEHMLSFVLSADF